MSVNTQGAEQALIEKLQARIDVLEADKKQGAKRIKEMKTGYKQYEARIAELEREVHFYRFGEYPVDDYYFDAPNQKGD